MNEPHDPMPSMIAELDQTKAFLPLVADLFFSYFEGLCDAGFMRDEALELTRDYAHDFVQRGHE